ncbi:hypothetical protein FHT15_000358 [Xanthomonas campestris]
MRTLQRSMLCIATQTDTAPARCAAAITYMHVFFRRARQLHCDASLSQCAWHMDTVDWRCWKPRVARGGMITVAAAGAPWRMAACRRHLVRCKWEKHSPCCDRLQRCATARRTAGALPDDLIVVHHHNAASGRNSKAPARSPGGYAGAGVVSRVVTRASPMQRAEQIRCVGAEPAGRGRTLPSASADEAQENPSKDNSIAITSASSRPVLEG